MPGRIRPARRPLGWIAPGPVPPSLDSLPRDLLPNEGEDLCYLSGNYRILQLERGNRWSLDELVGAWTAIRRSPSEPSHFLDLGTGVGSLLLMLAWAYPRASGVGIEAQAVSARLCERSLAINGCAQRCKIILGDLRDPTIVSTSFPLITGTPPYFPAGSGLESNRPQCGPARFEHRGGVEDYVAAARRLLAPDGRFVVCVGALERERTFAAATEHHLAVEECLDVIPREGKPPRIVAFTMAHEPLQTPTEFRSLTVRSRDGQYTPDYRAVRERLGLP